MPNDGGPVFPTKMETTDGFEWVQPGMTLRARIATEVMAHMAPRIVFPQCDEDRLHSMGVKTEDFEAWTAHVALGFADALIAALERTETDGEEQS